jgi:hypothetical protein
MNNQFADVLINCCQLNEIQLRTYIKQQLKTHNFTCQEDEYLSYRGGDYQQIHNLLAMRGKNPQICLVSHTDVCRDHDRLQGENPNLTPSNYQVKPVIKEILHLDKMVKVVQDQDCKAQVGGDDRVGVAISLWLAIATNLPLGILLTTDEEVGLFSAKKVNFPELMNFDLLVQIDRGNQPHAQIVTTIGTTELCDRDLAKKLIDLSIENGNPREEVIGKGTDVYAIKNNNLCKNAINLTCGYHHSYGSDPQEYIVIEEAEETMEYIRKIIEFS